MSEQINNRVKRKGREFSPFFCKKDRAKLFTRYTYGEYKRLSNGQEVPVENINYVYYVPFKWQTETAYNDSETTELSGSLLLNSGFISIKTNSLYPILKGDIVVLKVYGQEMAFIVDEDPVPDFILVPKEIQTFNHLTLRKLA